MGMDFYKEIQGRSSRSNYWVTMLVLFGITCGIFVPQVILYEEMNETIFHILFIIDIFYFVIAIALVVFMTRRRFNDAGIPPDVFTLLIVLNSVAIWFFHRLKMDDVSYTVATISFLFVLICCLKKTHIRNWGRFSL